MCDPKVDDPDKAITAKGITANSLIDSGTCKQGTDLPNEDSFEQIIEICGHPKLCSPLKGVFKKYTWQI